MPLKSLMAVSVVLLFGVAGVVAPAHATAITYTVTAIGTGSLGASNFTDTSVTISLSADTSTVIGAGSLFTNTGPAQVTVAGIGTATFTNTIFALSNHLGGPGNIGSAGIEDAAVGNILDTANAAFASYDLKSEIGPVSGPAIFNSGSSFPTSLGNFILTDVGNSTFTATFGTTPTRPVRPVPTLSEWAMMGLGLLLAAAAVWRLRRHSPSHG